MLSMEKDSRTHTIQWKEVHEESRVSASFPATGITEEPEANPYIEGSGRSKEWLISIMGADDWRDHPKGPSKPRIEKVPARIRDNKKNKEYFNPRVVSLGPHHHGEPYLKPMEKHKIIATRRFLGSTQAMERFYNQVMSVIQEARHCYAADTVGNLSDEALACMMFLDGCFVLYFIEGMNERNINLALSNGHIPLIVRDMFLFENQLPFVVLDALMSLKFQSSEEWKENILKFIKCEVLLPMGLAQWDWAFSPPMSLIGSGINGPLHLLDVLWNMLMGSPLSMLGQKHNYTLHNFGSVMELKDAGIRFGKSHKRYLTDIRFEEYFFFFPRLLLPTIVINDATISQLLNLTAFEMCSDIHHGCGVTSYICFLDSLINHGADVKELRSKGILYHTLGSDEEVARLINEWPTEEMNDLFVYSHVKERIRQHRRRRVKISIARWLHTYFGSPWTAISFVAAVLLLFFTCVQTVFTVFPRG